MAENLDTADAYQQIAQTLGDLAALVAVQPGQNDLRRRRRGRAGRDKSFFR